VRGQQIYELILGPHLCWEDVGGGILLGTEGILYAEILVAEIGLLPARGSRFSASPNVSAVEL